MRDWVARDRVDKIKMTFLATALESGFDTVIPEGLAGLPGIPTKVLEVTAFLLQ
jgi:hypothetical protein